MKTQYRLDDYSTGPIGDFVGFFGSQEEAEMEIPVRVEKAASFRRDYADY
jgi:hypothetical protein